MTAEQDVKHAIEERMAALKAGDAVKLEGLLADELWSVNPAGFVQSKQGMLDDVASQALKVDSAEVEDVRVALHADTAVAMYRVHMRSSYKGQDRSGQGRVMAVYVKAGDWKLVAQQVTTVRET